MYSALMDNIKGVIAGNLVKLRKQNKLTQLELAEKINYSDKAISRWEKGEVVPDVETLDKLCGVYNIHISKLFDPLLDTEELRKEEKINNRNKLVISMLAVSCVWFFAILLHVTLLISFNLNHWKIYIYAIPFTFIVAIVFNRLWGKRILNFIFISGLMWAAINMFYVMFFRYNIWPLYILGAPLQVVIVLWSQLK